MQRDANSIARQATRRKPIVWSVLAPIATPYMKLVQALLPISRTNGAPRSACRVRAAATICCERPGKPWVLDDETISASRSDHASPAIRRSSSSRPTVTGDSPGSKKRRARSPVFFSMSSERSRTLATMSSAASSSGWTPATRRSPISRLETTASGSVLAVRTINTVAVIQAHSERSRDTCSDGGGGPCHAQCPAHHATGNVNQRGTSFQPAPGSNVVIFAPMAAESLPRSFS